MIGPKIRWVNGIEERFSERQRHYWFLLMLTLANDLEQIPTPSSFKKAKVSCGLVTVLVCSAAVTV